MIDVLLLSFQTKLIFYQKKLFSFNGESIINESISIKASTFKCNRNKIVQHKFTPKTITHIFLMRFFPQWFSRDDNNN